MQDIAIFQLIVMILTQKMKLIIITIIKHYNSKHYIQNVNLYTNRLCHL
jgi:hypothetical protein